MLQINQGNEYKLTFNVKNGDGSVKNLTGTLDIKYQLAKRIGSPILASYSLTDPEVTIEDALNGVISIALSHELTKTLTNGNHYHEIIQTDPLGVPLTLMSQLVRINEKLIKE